VAGYVERFELVRLSYSSYPVSCTGGVQMLSSIQRAIARSSVVTARPVMVAAARPMAMTVMRQSLSPLSWTTFTPATPVVSTRAMSTDADSHDDFKVKSLRLSHLTCV
jgi:hypothetical protein